MQHPKRLVPSQPPTPRAPAGAPPSRGAAIGDAAVKAKTDEAGVERERADWKAALDRLQVFADVRS
jgi:hypothetical protein